MTSTLRLRLLFVLFLSLIAGGIAAADQPQSLEVSDPVTDPGPNSGSQVDPEVVSALYVDPDSFEFGENPKLLERITSTPHGYFRFINVPFSRYVCGRFDEPLSDAPRVNLHGDAHLEQYAVTDIGRGLTDFDDSSAGPFTIDLVRFGVSLFLVCDERGWESSAVELFERFLEGYEAALLDPALEAEEPSAVKKLHALFKSNRVNYLEWIDSLMEPVSEDEVSAIREAMKPYIEAMRMQNPDLPDHFFDIVGIGRLQMGIGSALDLKFLLRVAGLTDDQVDDLVLEIKEVRDIGQITCITGAAQLDPFRILVGQARISYTPFRYLGYVEIFKRNFWVHAWVDNYKELDSSTFDSIDELREVVFDVGVQLGRGHPKERAEPFGYQFRQKLLKVEQSMREDLIAAVQGLHAATRAAWKRFCEEMTQKSQPSPDPAR